MQDNQALMRAITMYDEIISFIRSLYAEKATIALHEPYLGELEKRYLSNCIDSTFVSSVGPFVDEVEETLANVCGVKHAIAVTNGTAALHLALQALNIGPSDEVITQPLTFVATCNAIRYTGAYPAFIDVATDSFGMCPNALSDFFKTHTRWHQGHLINRHTGRHIKACLPVHVFGKPCNIDDIVTLCNQYAIPVVEDAAEALASQWKNQPVGSFGTLATLSFNGNKLLTAGGGGAVLTNDSGLAQRIKHASTTAKCAHAWRYQHDAIGYNYRMPNLNAALLLAQLSRLPEFLAGKRRLANHYADFFQTFPHADFITDRANERSNNWLCAIRMRTLKERDEFLTVSNQQGVTTRPIWDLQHKQSIFSEAWAAPVPVAETLFATTVNLPSSLCETLL